jgi:hypothetical protein
LYNDVYGSFIHNSEILETAWMFIHNELINKIGIFTQWNIAKLKGTDHWLHNKDHSQKYYGIGFHLYKAQTGKYNQ